MFPEPATKQQRTVENATRERLEAPQTCWSKLILLDQNTQRFHFAKRKNGAYVYQNVLCFNEGKTEDL